ncbi:MAG: RNA-binding protein [Caloramator sp.]|jgi:ribosome-associated protein|uniref:Ribosome-associated protein n=1 Tax=Caloramator proteoclasticus DSM 10124 TaxID=1121262 RepID=A0A1M4ZV22_9CLOT|nr:MULTISPECIES: RNA-binding S4 domain-containing protein [Caloramator]MBZ4662513.1 RNA-binding protein [Caloramator sp.]GIW48542.1 MAG: RNA-binding protein [Caloramator sp.]SHF21878.1 ribosome-associated protein [Caloramator proteoclasticus DSM 10124]
MEQISINTEYIKLDQLLKWANIADSGAFAKLIIQNGDVKVNGEVVLNRGKKIYKGDIVEVEGVGSFKVV